MDRVEEPVCVHLEFGIVEGQAELDLVLLLECLLCPLLNVHPVRILLRVTQMVLLPRVVQGEHRGRRLVSFLASLHPILEVRALFPDMPKIGVLEHPRRMLSLLFLVVQRRHRREQQVLALLCGVELSILLLLGLVCDNCVLEFPAWAWAVCVLPIFILH